MGDVVPFLSRDQYRENKLAEVEAVTKELSPTELYHYLIEDAYETADQLISRFKRTGKWDQSATKHMRRVIDDLMGVCAAVSGVKNGQTRQTAQKSATRINISGPSVNVATFFRTTDPSA